MTTQDVKFRQAAWTYFAYGVLYMAGAVYLKSQGIGPRGGGPIWFILGALFILVFPWIISRGARGAGYLWFTRLLTFLVAYRAFEVGRIALRGGPAMPAVVGGVFPSQIGAWLFFFITLVTMIMLARAAWSKSSA
jgi:hypothetical protein